MNQLQPQEIETSEQGESLSSCSVDLEGKFKVKQPVSVEADCPAKRTMEERLEQLEKQ